MRGDGDAAVRCRLCNVDVAALDRGRCRRIMLIDDLRMPAVVVDSNFLGVLLEDEAARRLRCTAVQVRDAALGNIFAVRKNSRALVLIILIVALIASFVRPLGAVLQIEVRRAAVVDKAVESGIRRRQGDVQLACRKREEVAVEIHVPRARRLAVRARVHVDRALIGAERIVAVLHAGGNLNLAAAEVDDAVLRVRRDAVAVDSHIDIAFYGHLALFDLRQNAGVVEARKDVLAVNGNAPLVGFSARDFKIAVDRDCRADRCFVRLLAEAVALLYGDAVAAETARHRDVDRRVDRNV